MSEEIQAMSSTPLFDKQPTFSFLFVFFSTGNDLVYNPNYPSSLSYAFRILSLTTKSCTVFALRRTNISIVSVGVRDFNSGYLTILSNEKRGGSKLVTIYLFL
jgi:hypothetical protein